MKHLILILVVAMAIILPVWLISRHVTVGYRYERDILSYWSLADKASTIDQKSMYMDKFVEALEGSNMTGHNAIIFRTPDNDLAENFKAIKSLQQRLHDIKTMDVRSFEYQQAIQQITAQEQGEAHKTLEQIHGGWLLNNGYWYLWGWCQIWVIIFNVLLVVIALAWIAAAADWLNKGGAK